MAAIQPGVWGVDLGQCALKALRVEMVDGQLVATAFDYIEHPKILSQPDADPDQLTREALEKFLSRNTLKGDLIAMGVPGQSGLARFVKLPPVEEKKITDIVKFEAKQQIPFPLEEVVWDYQKIGSGAVTDGFAMETEIGLFAMKRDMINRFLQHFQDVNVEVHIVQMAPLALCNFLSYDLLNKGAAPGEGGEATGKKECVVALDIGADSSNLVITDGEKIIWQRPIPIGGNRFTRALTKDLKLTFAKAEHLKRNATKSPDLKKILTALKPELNEFAGEVQRSLGYFTNTHRDATVLYMVGLGGAFRLPGLQKFLSEKLQLEVKRLPKLNRLTGDSVMTAPVFTENLPSFGVAYGLALQGLNLPRLHTNLLPLDIRVERLVRSKKPWAVTAAAALLAGTAALALGYRVEHRAVASPVIARAMKEGKGALDAAKAQDAKCRAKEDEIKAAETAVKSVLAGQDERLNWIKFSKYVNDCLPRPDGSNLTDAQKNSYWNARAKAAYQKLVAHDPSAKKDPKANDDDFLSSLVQLNIEAFDARFTEDLAGYLAAVKKDERGQRLYGLKPTAPEDLKNELKGSDGKSAAGWVVELRGYVYHQRRESFVIDTLVANLNRLARKGKAKPAAEQPADAAAAAPDKPGEEGKKPEMEDPIANKISHAFLYDFKPVDNPVPGQFDLIGGSFLVGLVPGAGSAAGGMGEGRGNMAAVNAAQMAMMKQAMGAGGGGDTAAAGGTGEGAAAPRTRNWAPLLGGGTAGGMGEPGRLMGPMGPGRGGSMMPPGAGYKMQQPPSASRGSVRPTPPPGEVPGEGKTEEDKPRKGQPLRTEFVVLFVWQEPTPSDKLMTLTEDTGTAGTGPGGASFPGAGMMPGGAGGAPPSAAPGPSREN
jgi:type IV pilus assembly protein PilM